MRKVKEKKKPVIGMVAWHCCIRVYKEAKVLMSLGYEVHLVTNTINFGVDDYVTVSYFNSMQQLHNAIKNKPNIDIWHVHNEPDWLVDQALQAALPHQAVIFDIHDFESARWESTPFLEQKIMRLVDGCVHVSAPMQALGYEVYGAYHPPSIALPCHVPESWYAEPQSRFHHNVVYEGGLDTPYKETRQTARGTEFSFRDYGLLFEGITKAGYSMTVYPSNTTPQGTDKLYAGLGVWVKPQLDYPDLMPTLAKYSWGVVGSSTESLLMHRAMPNKLFEYMAAGVPVLVFNADAASQFVSQLGIGLCIPKLHPNTTKDAAHKHIEDFLHSNATPENWAQARQRVLEVREQWSMDAQISPLLDLYDDVLAEVKKHGARRLRTANSKTPKSKTR